MKHRKLSHSKKFFQNPMARELTTMRIKTRRIRRLTYDCMSAIVKGDSVVCKEGHEFKKVGRRDKEGMSLRAILRGMSSSVCKMCTDYDGETTE